MLFRLCPIENKHQTMVVYFKRGRMDTDDVARPGRPNEVVIEETIENPLKIILSNRKVKLQKKADTLKLSKGSIYTIIHDHLGMKKLFSKWVPRLLTPEEKQQRADDWRCLHKIKSRKIGRIGFRIATTPSVFSRSRPQRLPAFAELKKNFCRKRFASDEEVIVENEAYFEGLDKSFYNRGIEKLEKRWNDCTILKGDCIDAYK
nr:uncharacterized protein LOC121128360 [Lepeophtheirus salmonis]